MIWSGAAAAQPVAPAAGATAAPAIEVTGRVVDALGRPIRNATVRREDGGAQTTTDALGRFAIDAPVGTTLVVTSDRHEAALTSVTGPVLDDIVAPSDAGERIEITGQAPTPAAGAAELDREDIQRLPGPAAMSCAR